MKEQQLLKELYAENWENIKEVRKKYPELSAPLLIKVPKSYLSQKVRLMIIGQQTRGWGDGGIEDLLQCYGDFNFGESYYSSPFWNLTRKIETVFNIQKYSIAWCNLNRCDFNGSRPPSKIERILDFSFTILKKEIQILKPDVVIFFSGPNFDQHINRLFVDSKFHTENEFTKREMAKISHQKLPEYTYRTYHPKYLRISGIEPRFIEYIKGINRKLTP